MREIRYCVKNFWRTKDFKETWYYTALEKCCIPIEDSKNPQVVISSLFGIDLIPKGAVNILLIGESEIHCPRIKYDKNTIIVGHRKGSDIRFNVPFFKDTPQEFKLILHYLKYVKPYIKPREFCGSIISNSYATDLYRENFIEALRNNGYYIEHGGAYNNTLGYRVPQGLLPKLSFLSDYKFNIAMENSLEENYHTEKLLEGLAAGLPIYYGGKDNLDWLFERFNEKSFIYSTNILDTINVVKKIDSNETLFYEMRNSKALLDETLFDKEIENFYKGIENVINSIKS